MRLSDALKGMGKPVAYLPGIARICGSVNAGLLFSQLYYWSDKSSRDDGWFYKSVDEVTEETALSYKEQLTARKALTEIGILSENYDRTSHKMLFKINLEILDSVWKEQNSQSKNEGIFPKSICPKGSNHMPKGKVAYSQKEDRTIYTESTTESTQRGGGKTPPPEKQNSQSPEKRPNIDSPLAMEIRKVCKKTIILSPNDKTKMEQALMILEAENATVSQMIEFGRKVKLHWIGCDSKTKQPRAPGILQVAENWKDVLDIDENAAEIITGGQNANIPRMPTRVAHDDASLRRYAAKKQAEAQAL